MPIITLQLKTQPKNKNIMNMQKTIALFICFTITLGTFATNIPVAVKDTFSKRYPHITKVKWDKESENYEASFDVNKVDCSVLFDSNGAILETEMEIELADLPSVVLNYIKTNYGGKKAKEAARITDAKGIVVYEIELKGMDILFDNTGKFIKEVKD